MNLLSFAGATRFHARRRRTAVLAAIAVAAGAGIGVSSGVVGGTIAVAATDGATSFDSGTGNWQGGAGTSIRQITSPTQAGAGALELSSPAGGVLIATSSDKPATCITATAGNRYVFRVYTRTSGPSRWVTPTMNFIDSTGAVRAQLTGQGVGDSSSSWRLPLSTVGIAPAGATCVVVGLRVNNAAAGERHFIDTVHVTSRAGGARNVIGPLHTSGTQIIDGQGKPIIFRGVNRSGMEGTEDGPPTALDMSHAKGWGANFIRLPLGQQFWLSDNCNYDSTYAQQVDDAVNLITGKGMVVMLDLHWHTIGTCGRVGQWPMAEAAPSITFWKQVAARYKNNPLVAFDLYNEPHNLTDDQWRNGGTITWNGLTYQTAGMQQMYDAVRSTGATNLVMITGHHWGNWFPSKTQPISGYNIVYAIHAYTCPSVPAPQCSNPSPYDPSQFFQFWKDAEKKYPLMVTEFGYPNPDDGLYLTNVIAYAEAHHWSWSVYVWGKTWGQFTLLATTKSGSGFQPRPSGMPVLAAFPGN